MKLYSLVTFLAANVAANAIPQPRGCNANNCARAVTGTNPGKVPAVTSRKSDCSSFVVTTVFTDETQMPVATIMPTTTIPAYASPCTTPGSPASAYVSACSCWGITSTIVTRAFFGRM